MSGLGNFGGSGPGRSGDDLVEALAEYRSGVTGRRSRRWLPYALLLPGGLWLLVFFVAPTVELFATSLYDPTGSLATGYAMTWHWANYVDVWQSYQGQFLRSLGYSAAATAVTLLLGYPLAYAIAFKGGRWKNLMLVCVIAPFFTSFLVRTLAWKLILSDNGWLTHTLDSLRLLPEHRLLATAPAVISGLVYNFLPFMVLPLYTSLEKLDPRLLEAANDLYAGPVRAFLRVTLPISMPGLVAGTLLTFIPAAGDYINATLLGTPKQSMLGNVIDSSYFIRNDLPQTASLSFLLMAAILALVFVYVRRAGTEEVL